MFRIRDTTNDANLCRLLNTIQFQFTKSLVSSLGSRPANVS